MSQFRVRVLRETSNELPAYETADSAGLDLRANLAEPVTLSPGARVLIPTGLRLEIPSGYEGQVRPRSGLALKQGLTVLNSPGTIDADYRGDVGVILVNLSEQDQRIEHGDRVAQLVFAPVIQAKWVEVETLGESDRGAGGFGSTGKQ
jgi:dUTP pyrophosphatase